jgi:hypothetical protein
MVGAGVPRLVVSKILNHVETGITAVYDRHGYDTEKRAALDFWGKRVEAIIANKSNTRVLVFRSRYHVRCDAPVQQLTRCVDSGVMSNRYLAWEEAVDIIQKIHGAGGNSRTPQNSRA